MEPFRQCHCGSTRFWKGPRGGAAMNVACCKCGDGYNLLVYPGAPLMLLHELEHDVHWPGEREILDTKDYPHSAPTRSASQAPEEP